MSSKKNTKSKTKLNISNINVPNTASLTKIRVVFAILLIIMVLLLVRVGFLKFVDGNKLQSLATSQQTLTETLTAKRGTIYDSSGTKVLAISYDTDKIYINPSEIAESNKEIVAQGVSSVLESDYTELLAQINSNNTKFLVASDVSQDKVDQLNSWISKMGETKIKTGISFEDTNKRYYPFSSLASTVIGFVGSDNQGLSGIEYSWDSFLSGTAGQSVSLKDAGQSEIANSEQSYIAAENGYDINLTIDVNIQSIVEKYLAEAVKKYSCDSGITVAMDPSTGKIYAMADYPNYDCNSPNTLNESITAVWDSLSDEDKKDARYNMWKPKAVTDTYEPGSVFKIITSSIALEENITDTDIANDFYCNGHYYIEGEEKPIDCWKHVPPYHEGQTLRKALCNSCNPAFMQLGRRIGAKLTYKYYDAYGFFNKTGISLSGEPRSGGIFYKLDDIKPIELAIMSFGQRFTITPLQMITAASAIANGGTLLQPQIVDKITNTDTGEVTSFDKKEVCQVISKETADKVTSMMESVVTTGTGQHGAVAGYSIGGKTGTSEPRNGTSDGYVASFIVISPVENTKVVLLVILKNPTGKQHNGGQIAAPTASKMLSEILPYLGVESGNKKDTNTNISSDDLY